MDGGSAECPPTPEETLTSFLERLETAVNELQDNIPEEVTPALIYYIYRGSLNDQVREPLEKTHFFTNRARELSVEEKLRFFHSCLYKKRLREQQSAKKHAKTVAAAASSTSPAAKAAGQSTDAASKAHRCRTCQTDVHSYLDCDAARQRMRCHRCREVGHRRSECPKAKKVSFV